MRSRFKRSRASSRPAWYCIIACFPRSNNVYLKWQGKKWVYRTQVTSLLHRHTCIIYNIHWYIIHNKYALNIIMIQWVCNFTSRDVIFLSIFPIFFFRFRLFFHWFYDVYFLYMQTFRPESCRSFGVCVGNTLDRDAPESHLQGHQTIYF